ncbi:MAG: hypothetical protein IJV17_05915 [Prevotella sp.]|nr:hypothetical protein [Prevotella sp.]
MKKIKNIFTLLVVALVGLSLTACSSDDLDTNQYQGGVSLNAYGPNPVMRGGQLRFVGSNLDQIASITIPGVGEITNYEVVKAGVPSEIRITIPKDGPEVGYITLKTKTDQTITTKTQLTYIEGIEVTGFTPAEAMPGDVIKIEGDYLNLIHSLAFADGVIVSEKDFVSHDRYFIEVTVPEEAKTGKIELYTADLTIQLTEEEEDNLEYQIIVTEDALTVGLPTTTSIAGRTTAGEQGTIQAKAGETVTITGTYYNVVADVTVGGVSVADLQIANDGKSITFTLPAEAPSGEIVLVTKSEVSVPVGSLETVKPANCVASPNPVKAGEALQIDGDDMDLVVDIEFADANGEYTINNNQNVINTTQAYAVKVPDTAIEGNLKLVMANGERIEVPFTLVKPVVTAYNANPVSAGAELQITGTDLDLVKSVTFGEATADVEEVTFTSTGTILTVKVPMEGKSGKPLLNLANGAQIEAPELNINEAVFCYATVLPSEEDELKAGNSMTLTVANGDKLTGVQMNGTDCQWILTGDDKNQLIIGIPEDAKAKSVLRLISSNGEISYNIAVIPATSVNKVIWSGLKQISWSDGGRVMIPAAALEDVPAGAVLTLAYSQVDQQWDQAQFNYGDWSGINFTEGTDEYSEENPYAKFNQTLVPTTYYGWTFANRETQVILTQEILSNIQAKKGNCEDQTNVGIIIQGSGLTFSKVTLSYEISLEIDLASLVKNMDGTAVTYPYKFTWDDSGRFILSQDLLLNEIGVKKGTKFIVYKSASEKGQIQINDSSWSAITYLTDWDPKLDVMELTFDDAIMDAVNNGGLVLQGDLAGITKIAFLP